MCGISGAIGKNAVEKTFLGLKSLEYRGYDSWGIVFPENGGFKVEKQVGKIGAALLDINNSDAKVCLGHTRWATHGGVTKENAHPHISNNGEVAIVHNGIVENFSELKKKLLKNGFKFYSQTDSEVIANLIQYNLSFSSDFHDAFRKALLEVEGSYAVAAIHLGDDRIYCARNGSPLVIGLSGENVFLGSDATSFISYTNKAVFLEDASMAVLSVSLDVFDVFSGKRKGYDIKELQWSFEQAKKGNFEHFMLKEIFEQSDTIKRAVEQSDKNLSIISKLAKKAKNIFLLGCGSSYHACIAGTYFFNSISNVDARAMLASEFPQFSSSVNKDSLVFAVSQSGETADLIEAVKVAKSKGAQVVSIVNVMDSTLMRISDYSLLMNAGPEICVLSTKSYTSQLAILLLLAYSLAGKIQEGKKLLLSSVDKIAPVISHYNSVVKDFVVKNGVYLVNNIFVIGRGLAYSSALEAALKIKEVSYIHAEGFAGGELKHGTIALVENGTIAIVICTPETRALTLSNAIEMKSRGAFIIGVDSVPSDYFDFWISVPDCGNANTISLIIPMQIMSYWLAILRGLDPDKPRNLAKSVTVK
jgi:glucosamine--fructose-6-phosphate aminotransferase (isomerizing)